MHLEAIVDLHAAAFIGRTPWDVAHDDALIANAQKTAWSCYRQRQVLAGIDLLTNEAAARGAPLRLAENGERFEVVTPLFESLADVAELPDLDPAHHEPLARLARAARQLVAEVHGSVAVPVAGPLAQAVALVGADVVARALEENPVGTAAAFATLTARTRRWIRAIAACGAHVLVAEADYDPAWIAPTCFDERVRPALATLVHEATTATGHAPTLVVRGNTAAIASALCRTGAGMVSCSAKTSRIAFLQAARLFPDVAVRVELQPDLWTSGDWSAICVAITEASRSFRLHGRTTLGTGPLPMGASSVLVVDAGHFAVSMDAWVDQT